MCTGIRLIAKNNAAIYARTMEFGQNTQSNIIIIPRNYSFTGTAPNRAPGLHWQSKYAVVGANMLNLLDIVDGMNEKGLAGGLFYFPNYALYQEVTQAQYAQTIAPWELMTWILTNFSSVSEVKKAILTINVANVIFDQWNTVPPVHAIVHDASGESLVIEYVAGKLVTYDNPLGVITNAPTFDWHLTNLKNYLGLTNLNVKNVQVDGITISPFGQGSGLFGIPGDFTPPARFVRAVVFSQHVINTNTSDDIRDAAFHILNLFNIPIGAVSEKDNGTTQYDYTQWTIASNLQNKRLYWHTYDNSQLCMVDLMKVDLNSTKPITIPMQRENSILDVTPQS